MSDTHNTNAPANDDTSRLSSPAAAAADESNLTRAEKIERLLEAETDTFGDDPKAAAESFKAVQLGKSPRICDMTDAEIDAEFDAIFGE